MDETIDTDRIDDAVLALMYLTLHDREDVRNTARAWKSFDWSALGRLREKGMILDPMGKARSVVLTPEGLQRCEKLFAHLFGKS